MLDNYLTLKTFLLGAVVFLLVYYVIKCLQFRLKYRLPPGPFALPLVGNLLKLQWGETLDSLSKQYGPTMSLWIGPFHSVTLSSLETVDEALVKRATDFAGRPTLPSINRFTKGKDILFANYGPVWRVQRKIAHTAMRTYTEGDKLTRYLQDNFNELGDCWLTEKGAFNPKESITLFTSNIMTSMVFNEKYTKDDPEFQRLNEIVAEMEIIGNGFVSDFLPSYFDFLERKKLDWLDNAVAWFLGVFDQKIKKHRETFDKDNLRDLVDHIIAVGEKAHAEEDSTVMGQLTDDHFNQIIFDMFGAGTDSTRETLMWMLLFVGTHPDVQRKMARELDRVVGRERVPDARDVPELRYVEAVVLETLRRSYLLPSSMPHQTMCDTTVGGYDVPKGSLVFINLLALHSDPSHWDKPELFNPDRFIDEDGTITKPRAWMPFSGGRRVCPGESLARRELVYITALIFHRFTLTMPEIPEDPLEPHISSILFNTPKPFTMRVTERH